MARLRQRVAHDLEGVRILAAHVNVTVTRAHGIGRDDHSFDGAVRDFFHKNAVFEGAGLGFVGIADDILRLARRLCRSFPLDAGWKCRAAAADQSCGLHFRKDICRGHRERVIQSNVTTPVRYSDEADVGWPWPQLSGKTTDVATDKAHDWLAAAHAERGSLVGIGTPSGGFADKQCRRTVTQAQTGSMLDGELAIRADFPRLGLQVAAQGVGHPVAPARAQTGALQTRATVRPIGSRESIA